MTRTARALAATAAVALAALLPGCSSSTEPDPTPSATAAQESPEPSVPAEEPTTVRVASLKGPTTMGLVDLMRDAAAGETEQDYEVTMYGTPDEVVPLVGQGAVDVALIPANLAAVLYNRTLTDDGPAVQVAAINTLGVLGILENGDTVDSIDDLAGRTVYASGKGASPEYVLNYLLEANGVDPAGDLTIEWRSEHTEVAAVLASTPGAVGMLPQPFATVVTTQNPAVQPALDLTQEWDAVVDDGSQLVTGVVVVRTAFAQEHPQALAAFLADYEASTTFTNENPEEAATLIAEAGIVPAAPIAQAAIPGSHITFIDGAELRSTFAGYLQVLFDADPAAVGGTMPGDDFYLEQ